MDRFLQLFGSVRKICWHDPNPQDRPSELPYRAAMDASSGDLSRLDVQRRNYILILIMLKTETLCYAQGDISFVTAYLPRSG